MAVATLVLYPNSTSWLSVGLGIWRIQAVSIPIFATVSDTQPSVGTQGNIINPGSKKKLGQSTSTTWVRACASQTHVVAIPLSE